MKRHEVLGILPFIAAGALAGSVLGQTLSDGPTLTTHPVKKTMNGGVAGSADCCGDCEYAVDDGVSENTIGAGAPIVWYNYLETAGHSRGFMTFRWVGERDTKPPLPTVTKLPLEKAVARAKELGGR